MPGHTYYLGCAYAWHLGARLAFHLTQPFTSFSILGIFVRIAESNPFFTLPQHQVLWLAYLKIGIVVKNFAGRENIEPKPSK
jgi:hypothetical protein